MPDFNMSMPVCFDKNKADLTVSPEIKSGLVIKQPEPLGLLQSVIIFACFTMILFAPLLAGRSLYWGDIALYFEPMQQFTNEQLRHGIIPLWNPYLLCGQPFVGNPQMAVFYPLSVVAPFISASKFLSVAVVSHIFLCGMFMFLFLSRWVNSRFAALVGGIVYMGCSCIVARVQFPPMILSAPYFPLILWQIDRMLERRRSLAMAGTLGIIVALLLLAAHPQMAYLTILTGSFYALYRIAAPIHRSCLRPYPTVHRDNYRQWKTVVWLSTGLVLGIAIAAIQLAPMLELMRASTRERMTPTLANRFVFDLSHLATLIAPNFFGHPASGDYRGGGNAWEPAVYIGWLPLLASLVALKKLRVDKSISFWGAVAFLSIWLSTGIAGGLFWLAFYIVPGLSNFHDPARFLVVTTLAICFLTAVGIDELLQRVKSHLSLVSWLILIVTAAPLLWYGRQWNPTTNQVLDNVRITAEPNSTPRTYLPAHDVYWQRFVSDGYSDYGSDTELSSLLRTGLANSQMSQGIQTAAGYEPVPLSAIAEFDGLTRIAFKRNEPTLTGLVRLTNTSQFELPTYHRLFSSDFHLVESSVQSDVTTYSPNDNVSRAWLVRYAWHIEGKTRVEGVLASPDFDPDACAVVSRIPGGNRLKVPEPPAWRSKQSRGIGIATTGKITSIQMKCDCGSLPGFLVVSTACYPGWRATVDNRPAQLYCANGAFMGLEITPGVHSINVEFKPQSVAFGMYLSLIGLTLCAGFTVHAKLLTRVNGKVPENAPRF